MNSPGFWTMWLNMIELFRNTDGDIMAFLCLQEGYVKYVFIGIE